jgi:hypothetical protein
MGATLVAAERGNQASKKSGTNRATALDRASILDIVEIVGNFLVFVVRRLGNTVRSARASVFDSFVRPFACGNGPERTSRILIRTGDLIEYALELW